MTNAIKGALISGLVFPGLGQIVLRHYKRGAVIIGTVLLLLVAVIVKAVQHALAILEKIEGAGGVIDINTIVDTAGQATTNSSSTTVGILTVLLVVCWIAGVIDAYGIGRNKDIKES